MKLRPYQQRAVERIYASPERCVGLSLPTGGGKTVIAGHLIGDALAATQRVLFLAHRKELIRQPFCKLVRAGVDPQQIGIIMAGVGSGPRHPTCDDATDRELWWAHARRRPPAPVQIASVDSLRRRKLPPADLIIIDEAHRSLAKSYLRILENYPNARVVGLSATWCRSDGRGLDEVYGDLIVVATYGELVAQGFLVAPRVWSAPRQPDLSRVRVVAGDYNHEQLGALMVDDGLIGDTVEHWLRHGNNAPTFGFAVGVEHSRRMTQRFLEAGIPAAHVDGNTPAEERDRAFDDVASGRIKVLWNCDVASEGTDVPAVKTVISARPTKSLRIWLQQCGRGSRPHGSGLPFVILDHAGNAPEHGLPQVDRQWSLEGRKKKRKGALSAPLVWTCKCCLAANPLTSTSCEECGAERPIPERKPLRELEGRLVEVGALTDNELRAAWDLIVMEWRAHNARRTERPRKPGWCRFRFQERFNQPPPAGCAVPQWTAEEAERRAFWDRMGNQRAAAMSRGPAYVDGEFLPPVTRAWG